MGNQLLTLHCEQVPNAADSVDLRRRKHVGLVGTPVEARHGRRVRTADPAKLVLLDVPEQLRLRVVLSHPDFHALARSCQQVAALRRLPDNFRRRVLVGELVHLDQMLRRQRLLRLLVRRRCCLGQTEYFNFVTVLVHDEAAHGHCDIHVLHCLETDRVYSVVEFKTVDTFIGRLPELARLLTQERMAI